MPTIYQAKFAPPKDWQELQRIISDLYKKIWNDPNATEFGSIGQRQYGVDIYGTPKQGNSIEGVQCKCVDKLTYSQVEKEYLESQKFDPQLSYYIIATSATRDAKIQQYALQISQEGPYKCVIQFWEDICDKLSEYPEILKKYYSDFFVFETIGDSPGKILKIDINETHYELVISKIAEKDNHYGGVLLISDLLTRKCQTYRLGGHWSRLEGIIGTGRFDAFLISTFLNQFDSIDELLYMEKDYIIFKPNESQLAEFNRISKS